MRTIAVIVYYGNDMEISITMLFQIPICMLPIIGPDLFDDVRSWVGGFGLKELPVGKRPSRKVCIRFRLPGSLPSIYLAIIQWMVIKLRLRIGSFFAVWYNRQNTQIWPHFSLVCVFEINFYNRKSAIGRPLFLPKRTILRLSILQLIFCFLIPNHRRVRRRLHLLLFYIYTWLYLIEIGKKWPSRRKTDPISLCGKCCGNLVLWLSDPVRVSWCCIERLE